MGIAALNRFLRLAPVSAKAKKPPRNPFALKLRLEPLEDRRLLSVGDLLHTLADPSLNPQTNSSFSNAVASDGNLTVIGSAFADLQSIQDVGRAYVFNTTTGNLVATLINPTPAYSDDFGISVAISGNTVVVGAYCDDTGATDAGTAYIFDAITGNLLHTLVNPTPENHDWFGASVAVSGNNVVVGAFNDNTGASNAGSVYIYDAATGNLLHTLNNPTPASYDRFGCSVAVSNNIVVVGANQDDTGARDAGSAYIFNAITGNLLSTLANPTPAAGDSFGNSVAVSGNTVVVGAYFQSAGVAYLFDTATGNLSHTLANPSPAASDLFGSSVAVSGNTVVVGTPNDDSGAGNAGSAYIFDVTEGNLLHTLANPSPTGSDYFGDSVAVSGNIVVVGVPEDDLNASDTGSACFFDATSGNLLQTLANPTPAAYDYFGTSLAVSGNTLVVGVPSDDTGANNAGSAYIFNAATGNLLHTLANPSPAAEDNFGNSVAVSGNTIVVGTPDGKKGVINAGSAYIFDATTGNLLRTLANPSPASVDRFGCSVAISGNIVVVGAYYDDTGATDSGSAYIFNATTGKLLRTLANPTPASSDNFGNSVAVSGNTVVVGAYNDDTGATDSGSAYIFDATTGNLLYILANPTPVSSDNFGYSVAVSDNTVVVGAYNDDTGATDSGSAYIFNAATGTLSHTLANPSPVGSDNFGNSVAICGNTVVVGACYDDTGASNSGSAYIFDTVTGSLLRTLANPAPAVYDRFGTSVAVSNGIAVVGTPYEDGITIDRGAAYVFAARAPETFTWDGGGGVDNHWSTGANWSEDLAPIAGDNLVFPAGTMPKDSVNDYPAGTVFGSITVSGTGYNFTMGNSSSASVQVIDGGQLTANSITTGTLTIGGTRKSAAPAPSDPDAPQAAAEAAVKSADASIVGDAAESAATSDPPVVQQPPQAPAPVVQTAMKSPLPANSTVDEQLSRKQFLQATPVELLPMAVPMVSVVKPVIPPGDAKSNGEAASCRFTPDRIRTTVLLDAAGCRIYFGREQLSNVNSGWKTAFVLPDNPSSRVTPPDGDWLRDVLQARSRNRDAVEGRTQSAAVDSLFASGLAGM
jgi:hypothetical protein